jgi:hypothetical protein
MSSIIVRAAEILVLARSKIYGQRNKGETIVFGVDVGLKLS